eukprot:g6738.t1
MEHPEDRLPCRGEGLRNLRLHKWYVQFDWERLYTLDMQPPHKPKVRNDTDLANFRAHESDLPPQIANTDNSDWDRTF